MRPCVLPLLFLSPLHPSMIVNSLGGPRKSFRSRIELSHIYFTANNRRIHIQRVPVLDTGPIRDNQIRGHPTYTCSIANVPEYFCLVKCPRNSLSFLFLISDGSCWVSALAYPNLLRTRLCCCCWKRPESDHSSPNSK